MGEGLKATGEGRSVVGIRDWGEQGCSGCWHCTLLCALGLAG